MEILGVVLKAPLRTQNIPTIWMLGDLVVPDTRSLLNLDRVTDQSRKSCHRSGSVLASDDRGVRLLTLNGNRGLGLG